MEAYGINMYIYIYIKLATATVSEHISEGFNRMERVFFFFFFCGMRTTILQNDDPLFLSELKVTIFPFSKKQKKRLLF